VATSDDGAPLAQSLGVWLGTVTFAHQDSDHVTGLLVDAAVNWGRSQGWRVYRRPPSVVPLPPPFAHRHSVVDVGCARPGAAPVVIEVDRSDRQRTIDKLLAEAGAGRIALWVRWGGGPFLTPAPPVQLVPVAVVTRRDPASGRMLHSSPTADLPAPAHSDVQLDVVDQAELFADDP
jgi:hypothetical protein